jgi:hypothetical protein
MDKKQGRIKNKELWKKIREDIFQLQLCANKQIFNCASTLFLLKWANCESEGVKSFIAYFKESWLDRHANWYEGYAPGQPSTNNGLEAINQTIKKENTFRERLNVLHFFGLVEEHIVRDWSKDRNELNGVGHFKDVAIVPKLSTKVWTDAYQWAVSGPETVTHNSSNLFMVFAASSETASRFSVDLKVVVQKYVESFLMHSWEHFDDYVSVRNSVYELKKISIGNNCSYMCSCRVFMKQRICQHALGLAIRLREVEAPDHAKCYPVLGQKRKRGRPSIAKQALIRQ